MYEVVRTGEKITGEVTARLTNTMVVMGTDGYTHLCKLVGKPDKRPDFSLEGKKNNFDNAAPRKKVKSIEASGTVRIFASIGDAANHYGITRQTVSLGCKTGKATKNGKARGFQFSWA